MLIKITDKAKEQLLAVKEEKKEDKPLRVYIAGYG